MPASSSGNLSGREPLTEWRQPINYERCCTDRFNSQPQNRRSSPHEREGGGAAYGGDEAGWIGRRGIAAPGDMAVGTNEDEPCLVKRGDGGVRDVDGLQRQVEGLRGGDEFCSIWWAGAEAQQHETAPEQIERRTPR